MNYFEILRIKQGASQKEIKTAYRKLAVKWHPDRNTNDKIAEEKFKRLNEAYEFLMKHPDYKPSEFETNVSANTNSAAKSGSSQKKNTSAQSKNKETRRPSYKTKSYNSTGSAETRQRSYKDPNFDEDDTEQYSTPKFNTKPTDSYMNANNNSSEIDSFAKGCLIALAIIIGVPLLFFTCLLSL